MERGTKAKSNSEEAFNELVKAHLDYLEAMGIDIDDPAHEDDLEPQMDEMVEAGIRFLRSKKKAREKAEAEKAAEEARKRAAEKAAEKAEKFK